MGRHVPLRMCLGCREMKPKSDLMRVVRDENGSLIYDLSYKKNGRGAYLCRNGECLEKAVKNKGFKRALGAEAAPDVINSLRTAGEVSG